MENFQSPWVWIGIVAVIVILIYLRKSTKETFVTYLPDGFKHMAQSYDPQSKAETPYPKKYEALRVPFPKDGCYDHDHDHDHDQSTRPLAYHEVAQRGFPESHWIEPDGYRWRQSWRPYYYKNYPNEPLFLPPRPDFGSEQPTDTELLRMMEKADHPKKGESPKGYRYILPIQRPVRSPICADFAHVACKDQPYPDFCYNRSYGKCLNGIE